MSDHSNPRQEFSTYIMQERGDEKTLAQLHSQDQMMTADMGGVLPEQPDPAVFEHVLDVGCGTGGWLIEAAQTYPTMSKLTGIDINGQLISYASEQAAAQHVDDRVRFRVMDALRLLDLPSASFDLVNLRLGVSYLRVWDWPLLLSEFRRVSRVGGVIRITEADMLETTSPALNRFNDLLLRAFHQSGHFFTPEHEGAMNGLTHLLRQAGLQNVQTHSYLLQYRAGTPEGKRYYENMKFAMQAFQNFFRKWNNASDNYESLNQQALNEMQHPDFVANWKLLTVWGNNRK